MELLGIERKIACFFKVAAVNINKIFISTSKTASLMESPCQKENTFPVHDESKTKGFTEGKAEILVTCKNVFYNPVQEFNRDLSVAVLSLFAEEWKGARKAGKGSSKSSEMTGYNSEDAEQEDGITILEALSATGLRSIRFAKEVPKVKKIVANDISKLAVEAINENIKHNMVENLVSTTNYDASLLMYENRSKGVYFDAIDLDPYGCPSRFLDAAVQNVEDGGILLVTCTDMAVLCGNTPETCYTKYGAVSLRSAACHEMAIRITLQCIESHANRYGRYITPLLSFSADFYIRVVVKIQKSQASCKRSLGKLSHVYQCVGCKTFKLYPLAITEERNGKPPKITLPHVPDSVNCSHCKSKLRMGGPIWNAPYCDMDFITKLLGRVSTDWKEKFGTSRRMIGMLSLLQEELQNSPLFYTLESLCSAVHCSTIPLYNFRCALLNAGYQVSLSHAVPNSIKTNAPTVVLWDVVREWVSKGHPVANKRLSEGSVPALILKSISITTVDFKAHPEAKLKPNTLRYQTNPLPNWGPGMRSLTRLNEDGSLSLQPKKKMKHNEASEKLNSPEHA